MKKSNVATSSGALLIQPTGECVAVQPKGDSFTLDELQAMVGGLIQMVGKVGDVEFWGNEEGLLLEMPVNRVASAILKCHFVGPIFMCGKGVVS